MSAEVNLKTLSLGELFDNESLPLCIPDYQRTYCWREKNVYKLLDDIWKVNDDYHMGSIILQNKEGKLNIIDGQQRLVTLTLILNELGDTEKLPLLDEKIESEEAEEYIAYNKHLVARYINRIKNFADLKVEKAAKIRKNLKFAVLVLEDESLDLAYTFFSSQNSKGVKLTSYELLKSHHLHFIPNEKWAIHMAKRWDSILLDKTSDERIDITMGKYLFHMRKWLYQNDWDDNENLKVKEEFESALTIPEVPPFGEKFVFNEPIQGGTHFFAYTDFFINKCREFHQTETYKIVHKIDGETHEDFRDVMEALLFAYYLKFGDSYMPEAFYCISKVVSQYRYESERVDKLVIRKSSRNSKLMLLIDQASSPTFFLAAARDIYNKMDMLDKNKAPVMKRYTKLLNRAVGELKTADKFISSTIKEELDV